MRIRRRLARPPFFASLPEVPAGDLATAVLRLKGAVLDSLLAERQQIEASSDPLLRPLLMRAAAAREAWRRLEAESISPEGKDLSVLEVRRTKLETEFREILREFARAGLGAGGLAASATTSQIASALAPDALLIEMIRYPHLLDGTRIEDRYGALVMASKGEPKWISLGGASAIDENIELYRKSVRFESTPRNVQAYHESERDKMTESALHLVLRSLHDQVWAPIEKALPAGSKTIILSPDGALNFISFATLLDAKDEFLIEKYSIRYVASGRDLLREREVSATELMAVFGNPDFGSQPKVIARSGENRALAMRSSEMRDFKSISLIALPGANKECIGLNAQAKALGKPTELFLGAHATEAQLREIKSPRIVHLATHGFFLPESKGEHPGDEPEISKNGRPVFLKNPMHRSGLALAGAQNTLAAWAKDESTGERQRRDCHGRRGRRIEAERHLARGALCVRYGRWRGQSGRRGLGFASRVHSSWCPKPFDDAMVNQRRCHSADHARFLRPGLCERECTPVGSWMCSASGW